MGPTASGKTDVAIELCERFPLDVISVDSALVYRGMDIGTAKPDADTLRRTPHRLIDIRDPEESYSAGDFVRDAQAEMDAIFQAGRVPLLVGGTMMYFRALTEGMNIDVLGTKSRVSSVDPGAADTEFSLVRFGGDTERAAGIYAGMTPLEAADVAECIVWAATRPAHVNIDEIVVRPRDQATATEVHRG